MADNLVFGVKIDLQKGVEEALKDGDKALERIEKLFGKHPITIKLRMDNRAARGASSELIGFKKQLAELTQQWNSLTAAERGGAAGSAIREKFRALRTEAQGYTSTLQAAVKAEDKMRESHSKTAASANKLSSAYHNQSTYLSRLIQRMAAYAGVSYVGNFLTNVREVTAQFELQRISLGAIIQDQARANQLFEEIKTFALKSPVKILDLTKYTKQLAAYKIGVDELFETTKKLTDVSVGLGVSMDRVVLAYGQVRARGALYSSEIRQFTEMGVPIVEELAAKLSKVNGELVTSKDVLKLVEKGAISFELVKEVFDDMTSAGGIFYNMQEKQGNTLYGLWAKLGDAASVMYDEIGNTESVNKGMKAAIQALTDLMRNWQQIPRMIAFVGAATLVFITRQKILKLETAKVAAIQETYNARMARTNMLLSSSSRLTRAHGFALGVQARMLKMASTAAAAFGTSLTAIKSAIISTGWGALIMALGYVADKLIFTKTNAEKAAEAISKVSEETATETAKSVRNFEYLANKAVNAPKGSTEQKEALEELERTYSNILPKELLELEYLDKLDGKYGSLTKTIREYIAEQQRRKAIEEIGNVYGAEKQKYERKLTDYFREQGWTEGEIARFWEKFYDVAKDKSKGLQQVVAESVKFAGREGFEDVFKLLQNQNSLTKNLDKKSYNTLGITAIGNVDYIDMLRDAVLEENQAIEQNEERTKAAQSATNEFAEAQEKAAKRLKEVRLFDTKGESIDRDSYLGGQALANFEIKDMTNILKDGFAQAGLVWDAEYGNFINHINEKTPELISSLNFDAIIDAIIKALDNDRLTDAQRQFLENLLSVAQQSKERYEEIVPADPIVRVAQTRFKQIAQSAGGFREQYNQYLMKAGEDMATYNKRLKDSLEDLKNRVKALLDTQKVIAKAGIFAKMLYGVSAEELQKDIDETNKTISIIEKTLSEQSDYSKSKNKGSKGSKSDTRLQVLQEVAQTLATINKEYDDLAKKKGASKALADIKERFKDVLSYANKLGSKFGLNFGFPTEFKTLQEYRNAILKVMQSLKGLPKGSEKTILDFKTMIGKADSDYLQKQIEKQLKALSDRISRTKTAKEFYEKILEQTGDIELAAHVSLAIYGETGEELFYNTYKQIQEIFKSGDKDLDIQINAELMNAIDLDNERINYKMLADIYDKYQNDIIEKNRDTAQKLISEGQKTAAANVDTWYKELAKAKSYEEQRTDIVNREVQRRAEIIKRGLSQEEKNQLISLSYEKQAQDLAKNSVEEFKNSDDFIKVFQNLDKVSKQTLSRMKERLQEMIDTVKDTESLEGLKALADSLDKIDEEMVSRGDPMVNAVKSLKDYLSARKELKTAEVAEAQARAEYAAQETQLNQDIAQAKMEQAAAQKLVDDLTAQGTIQTDLGVAAQLELNNAIEKARKATDKKAKAEAEVQKAAKKTTDAHDKVQKAEVDFNNQLKVSADSLNSIAGTLQNIADLFGIAEDSDLGDLLNGFVTGLQTAATVMTTIAAIAAVIEAECWWMLAVGAAVAAFSAIFTWISNSKVRKANKEIERQQKLLDQLEYTYGRLEKAADKVFGADYVANQKQQQKILLAQQQAYMKQYEAEMSKGKKADEEKAQEFLDKARDIGDQIADMQGKIAEQMLGTDLTSAARDFAKAWLDAYKQFGNTADAMSEKFHEMIENMVVESLMAKAMQRALEPTFKMIDEMDEGDFYDEDFWRKVMETADQGSKDANAAGAVIMEWAKKWGYDGREKAEGFTGISKSVAGATSEEINNVAAIGNTLMYYVSPIPRIDENLARVVALMEGRTAALPTASGVATGAIDYTEMFNTANQHLSSLPRMEQHLAEIHTMLGRALRTKGSTTGFNTFLNS